MKEDLRRGRLRNERAADRRPLFRGMLATDSDEDRNSGRLHIGISGRVPSEWVADLRRNQWPGWVGIRKPQGRGREADAEGSGERACAPTNRASGQRTAKRLRPRGAA